MCQKVVATALESRERRPLPSLDKGIESLIANRKGGAVPL